MAFSSKVVSSGLAKHTSLNKQTHSLTTESLITNPQCFYSTGP